MPMCVINSRPQNLVKKIKKKHLEEFCNFEARGPAARSSNEYRASATLWGWLKNQTTARMQPSGVHSNIRNGFISVFY